MVRRARNEMHRGDAKTAPSEALDGGEAAALAAGLRAREPAAIAQLFERYGSSVHRTLIRIIGSDDPESSDLLHDTFLRDGGSGKHDAGRCRKQRLQLARHETSSLVWMLRG